MRIPLVIWGASVICDQQGSEASFVLIQILGTTPKHAKKIPKAQLFFLGEIEILSHVTEYLSRKDRCLVTMMEKHQITRLWQSKQRILSKSASLLMLVFISLVHCFPSCDLVSCTFLKQRWWFCLSMFPPAAALCALVCGSCAMFQPPHKKLQ